ncbi:MAG: hypothetical protein HQK53_00290 [Oligoflexia bacterium]|nr:hypothetical protein [Oligoflexia bacterium]
MKIKLLAKNLNKIVGLSLLLIASAVTTNFSQVVRADTCYQQLRKMTSSNDPRTASIGLGIGASVIIGGAIAAAPFSAGVSLIFLPQGMLFATGAYTTAIDAQGIDRYVKLKHLIIAADPEGYISNRENQYPSEKNKNRHDRVAEVRKQQKILEEFLSKIFSSSVSYTNIPSRDKVIDLIKRGNQTGVLCDEYIKSSIVINSSFAEIRRQILSGKLERNILAVETGVGIGDAEDVAVDTDTPFIKIEDAEKDTDSEFGIEDQLLIQ